MSTTIKTPETTTKPVKRLSFVTETRTKRGAWVSWNHFDVPAQKYDAGMLTGKRAALELLLDIKAHPEDYKSAYELQAIMADVAQARTEARAIKHRVLDTPTREGAANGFVSVVNMYFAFGAVHAEVHKHMASVIEQQVQHNEQMAAYDKKRKAASTAAGIATRRANKALKAAGGMA